MTEPSHLIEKLRTHATVIPWLSEAAEALESAERRSKGSATVQAILDGQRLPREEKVRARVDQVLRDSKKCGSSPDPLVQIAWLIHCLDLHHRTDGKFGHTLEKTVEYVTSSILHAKQRGEL